MLNKCQKVNVAADNCVIVKGRGHSGWELSMSERDFKLISKQGTLGGNLHLRYGFDLDDPMPFILTLTPQHVARGLV